MESLPCNADEAALDEPIEWTSEVNCSLNYAPRM